MSRRDQETELDLAARVARLTVGQRACLELVDDHATSKEIALRLGISRHTVDARLRQAMQILGVASRREAAVIWRAASGSEEYQPFAYQPPQVEPLAGPPAQRASETEFGDDATDGDLGKARIGRLADTGTDVSAGRHEPDGSRSHRADDAVLEVADAMPAQWHMGLEASGDDAPLLPASSPSIRLWGGANDLTPAQRLTGILAVALLGMLAFGLLLSGIEALSNLRA